jgi:hypothetical protein
VIKIIPFEFGQKKVLNSNDSNHRFVRHYSIANEQKRKRFPVARAAYIPSLYNGPNTQYINDFVTKRVQKSAQNWIIVIGIGFSLYFGNWSILKLPFNIHKMNRLAN